MEYDWQIVPQTSGGIAEERSANLSLDRGEGRTGKTDGEKRKV